MMNAKPLVVLIAATVFSVSSQAHDCSGGPSGGMDATGNQCNDAIASEMLNSGNSHEAALVTPQKSASATPISGAGYTPTSYAKTTPKKSTHRTSHARHKHN